MNRHGIIAVVAAGALVISVATAVVLYSRGAQRPSLPSSPPQPQKSAVDKALLAMSLRDKVASLFMMNRDGTDPGTLRKFVETYKLGGFIMMGENIPLTDTQLKQETAALRGPDKALPRLVAIDEEGGMVRRLPGDDYADAQTLKKLPVDATGDAFEKRSAMVQSIGVTLNFGIVADTTSDKESFIFPRVLGTSPARSADRVAAAVSASKGLTLTTLKHFPGHGETRADSHHTIPSTNVSLDAWQVRDRPPFAAGIAARADVVMMGHLRYPSIDAAPASLSKKWHDILRSDMGFNGVIITDAMGMLIDSGVKQYSDPVKDAILALKAGSTMLLYVENPVRTPDTLIDGVLNAVKNGEIAASTIDDNARALLELRERSAKLVQE